MTFYNIESIFGVFGRFYSNLFHFIIGQETKPKFRTPLERDTIFFYTNILGNSLKIKKIEEISD